MIGKKGQRVIANLLFFFIAIVIISLFITPVREAITEGTSHIGTALNGDLIAFIFRFWPVYFGIMVLIILIVLMRT